MNFLWRCRREHVEKEANKTLKKKEVMDKKKLMDEG
jgi:hypothetical protein